MKNYLLCFLFSIILSIILGFIVIPYFRKIKAGQNILSYVKEHKEKSGTPTFGGIIFFLSGVISYFIFSDGNRFLSVLSIFVAFGFLTVGFIDDYIKVQKKQNEGLKAYQKTLFQIAISCIITVFCYRRGLTKVYIPFSNKIVDFGFWFIPLAVFVFLATTNSVNLTDGLDGLAGGVSYVYLLIFSFLLILETSVFNVNYANVKTYNNLTILSVSFSGALIGYLVFNTNKATIFMGDTGSLMLGGLISVMGLISGNVLFIPLIGITFVISSLSVIIQVLYYKKTKKRVFLMAPFHHHLQHLGFSECKIAVWYKVLTLIFGIVSLLSFF